MKATLTNKSSFFGWNRYNIAVNIPDIKFSDRKYRKSSGCIFGLPAVTMECMICSALNNNNNNNKNNNNNSNNNNNNNNNKI